MLFVRTELATPGEPLVARLAAQFCPSLLDRLGLINSSDFPKPSCSLSQVQPRWLRSTGPRWRTAQSPSSAKCTLSTRSPCASSRSISSPWLLRNPVQLPTTLATVSYTHLTLPTSDLV